MRAWATAAAVGALLNAALAVPASWDMKEEIEASTSITDQVGRRDEIPDPYRWKWSTITQRFTESKTRTIISTFTIAKSTIVMYNPNCPQPTTSTVTVNQPASASVQYVTVQGPPVPVYSKVQVAALAPPPSTLTTTLPPVIQTVSVNVPVVVNSALASVSSVLGGVQNAANSLASQAAGTIVGDASSLVASVAAPMLASINPALSSAVAPAVSSLAADIASVVSVAAPALSQASSVLSSAVVVETLTSLVPVVNVITAAAPAVPIVSGFRRGQLTSLVGMSVGLS